MHAVDVTVVVFFVDVFGVPFADGKVAIHVVFVGRVLYFVVLRDDTVVLLVADEARCRAFFRHSLRRNIRDG